MKVKVFAFIKPSDTATMFSHKMARFVSQETGEPIIWNDDIAKEDIDLLIIVGGGMPFCSHLPALGKAVLRSKKVVYCTNDYLTTKLPSSNNKAKSPFRASFRLRNKRGMDPPEIWSTLPHGTTRFVNWNLLAWQPNFKWEAKNTGLLYYGSWRKHRIPAFDQFFLNPKVKTVISNSTDRFEHRYPKCEHIASLMPDIVSKCAEYGMGLYLKDPLSEYEPPACRFYEMLSAGLPMVFDWECYKMLAHAGYVTSNSLVKDATEIHAAMKRRADIAIEQRKWRADFDKQVKQQFHAALNGISK